MKCPICSAEMIETKATKKEIFKGKEIKLAYPTWKCTQCGNELVEMNELDKVWAEQWDRYEKAHGIPCPEEIKKSRERLEITGEELAEVLGRTKSLISKLENGERRLSDKLLEIYRNYIIPGPAAFSELLAQAKFEKRISDSEFLSLQSKIVGQTIKHLQIKESIIQEKYGKEPSPYNGFNTFKANYFLAILKHIIERANNVSNFTLFKVLFYSDAEYYNNFGKSLTGIRYLKNNLGPTPFDYSLLLSLVEESGVLVPLEKECWWKKGSEITELIDDIKRKDIEFIDVIIKTYLRKGLNLSKLTHSEPFWKEVPARKIIPFHHGMIKSRIHINFESQKVTN